MFLDVWNVLLVVAVLDGLRMTNQRFITDSGNQFGDIVIVLEYGRDAPLQLMR